MIRQLGRYEIIGELGQGAMGVVYKARDPLIDREVAIKTINLSMAMDERDEFEARFYQEAKAAGRLGHPNIVTIYDVGRGEEVAYIAMEYLQGRELRDILNETPLLPLREVLSIVSQVAQGLAYAHEHDIVHRDIKPSNVMIVRGGLVKITDFGIARMASTAVRTQTGMVLGSPKYMSPEQVMGKIADHRSDIFSLGVMLYEMLTGQVPFIGENVNAIMYQTLNSIPPAPSSTNPALPEMLDYIIAKALAKDLEARYQSAHDLAEDLKACLDSLPRDSSLPGKGKSSVSQAGKFAQGKQADGAAVQEIALGLSNSFDSTEATMRLAAMTSSREEVEELSKTLKIAVPGFAAAARNPARNKPHLRHSVNRGSPRGGYLLLAIVVIVLIGLFTAIFA
ncbi:MAG: serine/threonine protein kinase [Hydrogenophilales bacterium CG17_big_fil_post_rev_8_21_14_2_50_63_12]|nr:MAG: serine/threonine protein kinase [Hydrogenophilales bacterium CG17_big_fil_post_rev_8_21_14_2_50_63_12]